MNELIIYQLKAAAILFVLYLPYIFVSGSKHFQAARFYLLFIFLASALLPFIRWESAPGQETGIAVWLQTIEISATKNPAENSGFSLRSLLFFANVSVIGFFIARIFFFLFKIYRIVLKSEKKKAGNFTIVFTGNPNTFSFMNYLFTEKGKENRMVTEHELTHIHQKHSLDVLFCAIYSAFHWFNPLSHFIKKELRELHEYIADDRVLKSFNKPEYAELLLTSALSDKKPVFTHSFHSTPLKKRIIMMNKKRKSKLVLVALAAGLPLAVFATTTLGGIKNSRQAFSIQMPENNTENESGTIQEGETLPEYPGGSEAMVKFISENLQYPESAKKEKKEGIVYIGFLIDKRGNIMNAAVKRGFYADCDNEALRVIKSMPAWKPGTKDGKVTDTEMVLPIKFKL